LGLRQRLGLDASRLSSEQTTAFREEVRLCDLSQFCCEWRQVETLTPLMFTAFDLGLIEKLEILETA
jgi:hypothetical protein